VRTIESTLRYAAGPASTWMFADGVPVAVLTLATVTVPHPYPDMTSRRSLFSSL